MSPNWANLTKEERAEYMRLQMSHSGNSYGGGGYLPDDCSDCGSCGEPMLGTGRCPSCSSRYRTLREKLEAKP